MSPAEIAPATRYAVGAPDGVGVTASVDGTRASSHRLPAGTLVVCAETARHAGRLRVRIASPAGWVDGDALVPAPPTRALRFGEAEFEANHLEVAVGEHYGLEFPFTTEMIEASGATFLTDAFRAAGTLGADNRVVSVDSVEPYEGGQASDKAFLRVTYQRDEPGLSRSLFVKVPAGDAERKRYLADTVPFEIEFARLSAEHRLAFDVPRYYYGDYSARTSNFILVTDRVSYGEDGIAPPCFKGYDHLLPDAHERYVVLTRALAALAADHKRGALGTGLETIFPFPRNAPRAPPVPDLDAKLEGLARFVGRTAPQLFPEWATKPDFLDTFRADVRLGLAEGDALARWLHADVDYVGLCHPNLNLDNAWFWHDEAGQLRAGLLDWGMTRQMAYAQALSGMLMFPEPEGYGALVADVIRAFVDEFERRGGQRLDPRRLREQLQVSLFMSTIGMVLGIVVDQFDRFSAAEYESMADRFDARLLETGLCAGVIWVRNVLEEWAHETTPGDACRAALEDRGITGA